MRSTVVALLTPRQINSFHVFQGIGINLGDGDRGKNLIALSSEIARIVLFWGQK